MLFTKLGMLSVNAWKRIITVTVLAVILALIFGVFWGIHRNHALKAEIEELTAVDIEEEAGEIADEASQADLPGYASLYPDLYVDNDFVYDAIEPEKVCYLTFDDGPAPGYTEKVLNILDDYDVKATFFVVYNDSDEADALYQRMVNSGHAIGVHTASHNYSKIYSSVDNYLKDFEKVSSYVESVADYKPEIFRFPGGSINSYNIGNYMDIISEMLRRGYTYYDWNVSSGDAASSVVSKADIVKHSVNGALSTSRAVILMHDGRGHKSTVEALPEVIKKLKAEGYEFRTLSKEVKPVWFGY